MACRALLKENIATLGVPIPLGRAATPLVSARANAPPTARLRVDAVAGHGPLQVGTDIGGPIRLPAGWFGGFGLKPSHGRVPIGAPYPARVAGPITAAARAFAAELRGPTNDPTRPFEHIAYTLPFNMSEQPAASINAAYTQRGLQIVWRRFDDLGVLQLARAWEQTRPAQRPWPMSPPWWTARPIRRFGPRTGTLSAVPVEPPARGEITLVHVLEMNHH